MPLIHCPKCGQTYDIPGVVAVRLSSSIATCHCGEWLSGSKAAVLARIIDVDQIREIDMTPYRVDSRTEAPFAEEHETAPVALAPRSVRIIAKGAYAPLNTVFTLDQHPLWIGRRGSHVELENSDLSLRHCSIFLRSDQLLVRDAESHMGTFLDGQKVEGEAVIPEGVHLLRLGSAIVSVEPTAQIGLPVEPISLERLMVADEAVIEELQRSATPAPHERVVLVCVEGPLSGQEFEIPPTGLVVGREGHVRVPDEFLSRRHFEVVPDEEGSLRVRDLGSRNGTFLNTLPARNTRVHAGDEITAGNNRFRVDGR